MTAEEREKNLSCWQILCKEFDAELSGICFLDIETTGFSRLYESIYLIGFTFFEEGCFITQQYLAGSQSEEGILLRRVLDDLRSFKIVATYNGDMFDLPFIKERSARLHIRSKEDSLWFDRMVSLDLMRRYRPYKAFFGWPNMKLKTVEMSLGASRRDPFDGGQLIEVYKDFERSPNDHDLNLLIFSDTGCFHQGLVDSDTSDIVKFSLNDSRPVDLTF